MKYPVTLWAVTGAAFYGLKVQGISSAYKQLYGDFNAARRREAKNVQ